jgi:tetratricopeptide (TPR) repeat protein
MRMASVFRLLYMALFFWKTWSKADQLVVISGLALLMLCGLGYTCVAYLGLENVVSWNVLSELVSLPGTIYSFTDGLLTYPITGRIQTVTNQFAVSPMQVDPAVAALTVGLLCVALSYALAAICRLPALRYRIAMALFVLLLAVCRLEVLGLPGSGRWPFLTLVVLFGGISYYFHSFGPETPLLTRLLAFIGAFVVVAIGITLGSTVAHPAQVLLSYALPGLVIISILFIAYIAIDIVGGLVWLTSVSRPKGRPLGVRSFIFISVLYLVNLLIIWLRNNRSIDWNAFTISPFLILLVSIGLGLWGFRQLTEQRSLLSFSQAGAGLYIGLAALTTLTVAYAFVTANDPLIEVFEDAIVYSHFVMGFLMVLYVLTNFLPIYNQQLPVHRVLYKARLADLPLFRLAGVIGIVGISMSTGYFTVRQGYAACLSALGDTYQAEGQADLAQTYYQESVAQEYQQHKANYALASMALGRNDPTTAALFFSQALRKQPSPQAFIGLCSTYQQTNLFFEAIKTLQRGIHTFPDSGELRTNLGYLYGKTAIADSAYYYLKSAADLTPRSEVPLANLLALYARNPQILASDSTLAGQIPTSDNLAMIANLLALRLLNPRDTTASAAPAWLAKAPREAALGVGEFAGLYNYAMLAPHPDTALCNTLQQASLNPANQTISDELALAGALATYKAHRHHEAFDQLTQLATNDARAAPTYRTVLGLLELEQGLTKQAAAIFTQNTDTLSMGYRAVAMTKSGELAAAKSLWETATQNDAVLRGVQQALYTSPTSAPAQARAGWTDLQKAFYVSYRPDDANRGKVWETIHDASLKTVAGATLVSNYLATRQYFYAQMMLSQMGKPEQLTPFARSLENLSAVRITAFRNKAAATDSLAKAFFVDQHLAEVALLRGQALFSQKQATGAKQAFQTALRLAPLNAVIVSEVALFMRKNGQVKWAYASVLPALDYNEASVDLLKTYVLLCLDQSLTDYADDGLTRLQVATTPADYQAFEQAYQQKLAVIENARTTFRN